MRSQGQRSGQGWMLLPDGGLYQGGFEGDKFSGQGAYQYPSQCCYIGQWSKGLKHGLGTYWDEKVRGEGEGELAQLGHCWQQ